MSAAIVSSTDTHRICKVNIRESPILACSYNDKTVYLVLDTGATASLISEKQAKDLNLRLYPTTQKAVQVDGETDLPILGEVHTSFTRGNLSLKFDGLVVANLGVDILAGTPFHMKMTFTAECLREQYMLEIRMYSSQHHQPFST